MKWMSSEALTDPKLSEQIQKYEEALRPFARRLVGRDGAEMDDRIQEGRISVWVALSKGVTPSMEMAYRRMLMWVRTLRPQNPTAYEEIEHGG